MRAALVTELFCTEMVGTDRKVHPEYHLRLVPTNLADVKEREKTQLIGLLLVGLSALDREKAQRSTKHWIPVIGVLRMSSEGRVGRDAVNVDYREIAFRASACPMPADTA